MAQKDFRRINPSAWASAMIMPPARALRIDDVDSAGTLDNLRSRVLLESQGDGFSERTNLPIARNSPLVAA
jgi:hypothetical protein